MATLNIVADENIPYVKDAFSQFGDVTTLSGRGMSSASIQHADILLVRSVTQVNAALLAGSRVRFVGTATIGEDHIDKEYLAKEGIRFDSAPGSNADSVADYLTAALLELGAHFGIDLPRQRIGIIGVGNVGSRVAIRCEALGMECVLNDPPLARLTGDPLYRSIEEIYECDIVTIHVPLTYDGPDATFRLAERRFFEQLKPRAIFINTARGPVMDEQCVLEGLESGELLAAILDVWNAEPDVDMRLLRKVFIGTPHIAGYSFDGKVNGTRMLHSAVARFLGKKSDWDPTPLLPQPECGFVDVEDTHIIPAARKAVQAVYSIRTDDQAMRRLMAADACQRAEMFDRLRKEYPRRREFSRTTVRLKHPNPEVTATLQGLSFQVASQWESATNGTS
ncbi:MAG: erythronate-4-phosphate dehydrogenase [Candidatus Hydrogenedentota bacterium]